MNPVPAALLVVCTLMSPLSFAAPPEDRSAEKAKSEKPAKPSVQKGMTPEEVVAIIGKPAEVKPIEAEGVTSESWIYRRVAKRTVNQVPAPQSMGGMGMGGGMGSGTMRNERITFYQMTALLFVEGRLSASKQWIERESHLE